MKKPDCRFCMVRYGCDPKRCAMCDPVRKYQDRLEKRRKFKMGDPITSMDELMKQEFVYLFGGIRHKGFVHSQMARTLANGLQKKAIFYAVLKAREDDHEQAGT